MRNNTAVLIPLENVGSFAPAPMPCLSTATDICFYWLSRWPRAIDAVVADLDFNRLVEEHYQPLYRFAFSLSRNEPDACDLVQQAFARWAAKGHQLRDTSKAKTWLFTTLYREFLIQCRRAAHLLEPDENTEFVEPPDVSPSAARAIDAASVQRALHRLEERYRAPLTLFYMEQHSYREIAEILAVPIGTVMSRISRGKAELRKAVGELAHAETRKVIPMDRKEQNG